MTYRPRDHRVCFKTSRANYWWLHETAKDLGMTTSSLTHYIVDAWLQKYAGGDEQKLIDDLRAAIDPINVAAFERQLHRVEKSLDDDAVPF